jgi:GTP-binding protein
MEIRTATYVISSPDIQSCPPADRPEYAFIGRSNVGKSSLINMITDIDKLAKTSAAPGKTRLINHFAIDSINAKRQVFKWYLVDLPGYGFAKVSQAERKKWEKMIDDYLRKRETLIHVFLLVDSRHSPQRLDLDFVNNLGKWEIPFTLVFTKSDKENQRTVQANVKAFLNKMLESWQFLPRHLISSAVKKTGREDLLRLIGEMNEELKETK